MTSALQAQLAQIAAKSTNSLDLKAQKKSHSQSLLFEPRVAATQDFDTIYQICYEGFQELCQLDSRFMSFARNIFSEQSKQEDRTQMTAAQNSELDVVLEDFLGLVGARLLLKPAQKAVEWLVRRFKVHEQNTLSLLLTFLPYHTTQMFPTLLSVLPSNTPPALKFLQPYTQSLTSPSRHTIVYSAAHNQAFFSALNTYVLRVTRAGHHYRALTSFWAATATEAIASMLDQSRSGRREVQGQKEEDVLLRVLPMLNEGLSMKKVPEFRVACYMILTVLATNASLNDKVLTAMMEAITSGWTEDTTHAGLICLSVLAQRRQTIVLPKRVLKALLAIQGVDDDLVTINKQYTVEKLALGLVLGVVDTLGNIDNRGQLLMVRTLLEAQLIRESSVSIAVKHIMSAAQNTDLVADTESDIQGQLADLILRLADSTSIGEAVQKTIADSSIDVKQLESKLQTVIRTRIELPEVPAQTSEDTEMIDTDQPKATESFEVASSQIPTRTAYEVSFLSHSKSYVFGSLCHAFLLASTSAVNVKIFSDSLVLRKHLAMTEPLYLSFFARIWCGDYPATARVAAVSTVLEYFKNERNTSDVQALLPYVVYALADSSKRVRESATELVLALATSYAKSEAESKKRKNRSIWGYDNIYGQGEQTKNVSWITTEETAKFIEDVLVPGLEECVLDATYISRHLSDALNGSKHAKVTKSVHKEMKTALRVAILSSLSSHIINTPLYTVKLRLLTILNPVEKVGSTSRTKALLPLLVLEISRDGDNLKESCDAEHIEQSQFTAEIVGIVSAADREGVYTLQSIIEGKDQPMSSALVLAALQRVQAIWPSMKADLQMSLARTLLTLAVDLPSTPSEENRQGEAVDILRSVPLSTNVLLSFLEDLPTLSDSTHEKPSAAKRRRTSHGHMEQLDGTDKQMFALSIRKITLVLELIDASKPERHPQLLKGLFHAVGDLQHCRVQSGAEMGYLQTLALGSLRAIVEEVKISGETPFDRSSVRTDILVDCIRTTASPQVQHAALLLISSLASVTPDVVLHSVMPIFTFMGANLLRQDDEYSAHVITQTIDSVIPPLVDSLRKQKEDPVSGASELLLSFAAAFEHIPSHRRFGLFYSLVNKLGSEDFLFALIVTLANKYPGNKNVVQFAADLASRYGAETQLITVGKYVGVVHDVLEAKTGISEKLLALGNEENRAAEGTALNLLPLLAQILNAERLTHKSAKILRQGKQDAGRLREIYSQLIEQVLTLSEKFKAQRKLHSACGQVLNALLNLLSMEEFTGSLESLLDRSDDEVRRHVLRSLEQRVNLDKGEDKAAQEACLSFLPRLTFVVENSTDPVLKHTAIACIDRIAEKYGKKDVDAVASAARIISGDSCLGATDSRLCVMALLCLASAIEVVGEAIIPVIPQALRKSIEHLHLSMKEEEEDARLHNAVYSFMGALLLYVPWIVTGTYLDQLLKTSYESANAEMGEDCDQSRIEALRLIAKQADAKECFAALERTWTNAMIEGPQAVGEHLEILSLAIEKHPKSVIAKNSSLLSGLFLKYFDLRRIQCSPRTEDSYEEDEIEAVEDAVNEVAIKMIYKLNDATFRPVFIKFLDWATATSSKKDSKARLYRQTTWYSFLNSFFETLKSIVTSYAGFVIDSAVEVLSGDAPKDETAKALWRRVLHTLHGAFEHDQDEFWQSPSHFSAISTPLLAQLKHAAIVPMVPEVIPTITELAVAADSADHHKEMNATILKYMRSDSAAVRLAAVQCEQSLTDKLGEEWLALLPEMLPYISELQEDDDETVERETQRWILTIEGILGESLDSMLQ